MDKKNIDFNIIINFTIIAVIMLFAILALSFYFSDLNIGNKVGFGTPIELLT